MKKIVCVFGFLGLTFTSGLCVKQRYFDKNSHTHVDFQNSYLPKKGSVCFKSEGMSNRIRETWINADSMDKRHALSLTITRDTLICWNGFREEMYKLKITEESLFRGVQLQNEQERLKYKPKVLSKQKIVKLTEDSLIFSQARYYNKK